MSKKQTKKPSRAAAASAPAEVDGYELRVLKGADAGAHLPLQGSRLVLGRAPACDAVLHDEAVAEQHLQAVFAEGVLTLLSNRGENEAQSHPVWLNGALVKDFPHDVRAGDTVQIGQTIFAIGPSDSRSAAHWPAAEALTLMALPRAEETPQKRRARRKLRIGLWGSVSLGGIAVLILAAAVLRQLFVLGGQPALALDQARTQLDFALRTDSAFMHVQARTVGGAVVLDGLVGQEADFQRLRALAEMAQFTFEVENGAMVAHKLRDALRPRLPFIEAQARLKGEGQLHIALEGQVPMSQDAKAFARSTAKDLAAREQWPNLTLSFMLEDYDELLLRVQDALDEEPALDGLVLKQTDDRLRLSGALLQSHAQSLEEILLRMLGAGEMQALVQQDQLLVPSPPARLLGWSGLPAALRYQDDKGEEQELAAGDRLQGQWRVLSIEQVGAWLQYGEHKVMWPNPSAPRRAVNLDVLAQSLQAALDAEPIFGELKLTRKAARLVLRGGLTRAGEERLQEILQGLTGDVRARHRLLLRITQVPNPDGEVITIFDGATKAVRMRRQPGQERLVKIGELLGNGLKLTDIVDGTIQVQFGDVTARLQVGGAQP